MGRPQCRYMNAKLVSENSMVMYLHDQDFKYKLSNGILVSRKFSILIREHFDLLLLTMDVDGQMCCFHRYCNFTEG